MSNNLLELFAESTREYINQMPKSERKKKGQFFTSIETARFMAAMFDVEHLEGKVRILDPGAGTGILSCALIERIVSLDKVTEIDLTCYEIDSSVLPTLKSNLEEMNDKVEIAFNYCIMEKDYLLSQEKEFNLSFHGRDETDKFDFIISNPPYLRVLKNHPAAVSMSPVVHGAPNLYFLFMAMSLFNLTDNGEMVYIVPRSWTSGAYFRKFREYLLGNGTLDQIHLFVSRKKVFSEEQVLQETMIIKISKGKQHRNCITISSSENSRNEGFSAIEVPYDTVVSGEDFFIFLPVSPDEVEVLKKVNSFKHTLPECNLRMRTGIVVDFRQYDDLRKEESEDTVPLFYAQHIKDGRVNHLPSGKEFDWISDEKPGLIQKNMNYVFCKRFTAKEEKRRLQCGIYLAEDFPDYSNIATQNKINYISSLDKSPLTLYMAYGIYVILNSSLYDKYYRILNGSTQVNSTEINCMPIPDRETIRHFGEFLFKAADLTTETCDNIMEEILNE